MFVIIWALSIRHANARFVLFESFMRTQSLVCAQLREEDDWRCTWQCLHWANRVWRAYIVCTIVSHFQCNNLLTCLVALCVAHHRGSTSDHAWLSSCSGSTRCHVRLSSCSSTCGPAQLSSCSSTCGPARLSSCSSTCGPARLKSRSRNRRIGVTICNNRDSQSVNTTYNSENNWQFYRRLCLINRCYCQIRVQCIYTIVVLLNTEGLGRRRFGVIELVMPDTKGFFSDLVLEEAPSLVSCDDGFLQIRLGIVIPVYQSQTEGGISDCSTQCQAWAEQGITDWYIVTLVTSAGTDEQWSIYER